MAEHQNVDSPAGSILQALRKAGINFLAIDFDMTLIQAHTSGSWKGNALELSYRLRPVFLKMLPGLIDNDIHVGIVTFSGQTDLVRDVLREGFPHHHSRIVCRCRDKTWGDMGDIYVNGKMNHIASAAEELTCDHGVDITRSSTLLIDDDSKNIELALDNSVRAILFAPDDPNSLVDDLLDL